MAGYYSKEQLKEQLEVENIYDLLVELGGEPEYTSFGLIASTICHNLPGEGSRKLYYYEDSKLFSCFTSCGTLDIFQVVINAMEIQKGLHWELYDAMSYIAGYFGLGEAEPPDETNAEQWALFKRHDFLLPDPVSNITLPSYSPDILGKFLYPHIASWEKEGIKAEVSREALIGYYPGNEQITIPHFDQEGRLIGIRGRFLAEEDADAFGKYRPLKIGNTLYTHPLSMNLYNLNNSKENIRKAKAAIVLESEKSCLQIRSFYGNESDISVACCGSSLSNHQFKLLEDLGVQEIVLAFDRQFQQIEDDEFIRLKQKLIKLNQKYGNTIKITTIFDKDMLTPYKSSPTDQGVEIFEKLLANRFVPTN